MLPDNRSERAIIVLDMINKFAHVEGSRFEASSSDIVHYIQGELQYFRERSRPVIFGNTKPKATDDLSERDLFDQQVIQQLSPRSGEITLDKSRPNAFFKTDLATILYGLRVKNLTIVGIFSHTSVLLTAASALDFGYSVVVPETCVCSDNAEDHATALRLINRWLAN